MSDVIEIIDLTASFIPDAAAIERACFSHPIDEQMFRSSFENTDTKYIAARIDGAVVGYMGYVCAADQGFVENIAVLPEYRRRGAARAILAEAAARCRADGASFLSLEVRASNAPAVALYESFGFERQGVRPHYYTDPREDALIMTLFFDDKWRGLGT